MFTNMFKYIPYKTVKKRIFIFYKNKKGNKMKKDKFDKC